MPSCRNRHEARGWCNKHYLRWRHSGDPLSPDRRGKHMTGRARRANPAWKDEPTYAGVHARLRRYRGPASDYPCDGCGEPAQDWAFDEPHGFSTDLSRYRPLCKSCHARADR